MESLKKTKTHWRALDSAVLRGYQLLIMMFHRFSAFTFPLLLLFGFALLPQHSALPPAANIHTRIEGNDPAKAERQLRELQRSEPEAFARNNYDYLLGRLLEQRGAHAEAAALFQKVVTRNSPLAGYALWHQAEIARADGKLKDRRRCKSSLLNSPTISGVNERFCD
jgi:hypothetical protein